MFYGLSLLAGMLISVMVVFNGGLNAQAGTGLSLVIIHVVGLLLTLLFMLLRGQKYKKSGLPLYWYVGGFIGIITTLFNLRAYGHISVSAMMALGLMGESLSGLVVDHTGFMGMPVRRFRIEKLLGGLLTLTGIIIMLTDFDLIPVLVSLLAGVSVLLSRIINGRVARAGSVSSATLINYITGLSGAALVLLFQGLPANLRLSGPFTNYLGGALGAIIVIISNMVVGRISSFYMTLTLFVGQVTAGLLLDMFLQGSFPLRTALGGLFVLLGLLLNLMQDKKYQKNQSKQALEPNK